MRAQLDHIKLGREEFFQEMQSIKYQAGSGQSLAPRTSTVYDGSPDLGAPHLLISPLGGPQV
ncbi:MAG: hypothetical protein FJ217_00115 [Ignavibacteria bacterium]|nr:hypothetical protein [Ignavibacteria bacterium]